MKAIIIGATSGIGRELATILSGEGYVVGITGRRTELLNSLQSSLPGECFTSEMDLSDINQSVAALNTLIDDMKGIDLIIISSGTGSIDPAYPLQSDLDTIAVNVTGFTAMANVAYHYFSEQGKGHIVGISSIAAVRGGPAASYNASKAYVSSYLEGLACRIHSQGKPITVTDVRPGFVDTAMAQGEGIFWRAPVEKAASQIIEAIKAKKRLVYITKRWRLIAWILKAAPHVLYRRLMS
mgnify:CR=1 FL=1